MPKSKTPKPGSGQEVLAQLAKLPRRPDLVIEGGKRTLGMYIRENRQTFQPQIALWSEADTGFIRAAQVIDPAETGDGGVDEALQALVNALGVRSSRSLQPDYGSGTRHSGPRIPMPQPGLPGKIRVNDQALVRAAREMLAPLDIEVEYVEDLPGFEQAFQELSAALGANGEAEPPKVFAWDVAEELLPPLYKAAASYWRRAPWEYLGSDVPLGIEVGEHGPQPDVRTLYAVVLGNGGEVFGLAIYYSLEAFERVVQHGLARAEQEVASPDMDLDAMASMLRQAGAPVDEVPPEALRQVLTEFMEEFGPPPVEGQEGVLETIEDGMVLFFNLEEEVEPTYLEWLQDRKLKYASAEAVPLFFQTVAHTDPTDMNEQDVKLMTLALEALNQFFSAHRTLLERRDMLGYLPSADNRVTHTAHVGEAKAKAGRLAVEVSLPPEDYKDSD